MNWNDVLQQVKNIPAPPRRVEKTEDEWRHLLTTEQFRVARQHGTERPFSGEYCESQEPGLYKCVCCGTNLFDSTSKFNSRTGWPSFNGPIEANLVRYIMDGSFGMKRVEVLCNICDAHLGHVFPDGPPPTGLRFCINSISLKKNEEMLQVATLGGGCFWCTEAVMQQLKGVEKVVSGYAGGRTVNPTYMQISYGDTGHAEVVQVHFKPSIISYADILRVFFATHNPTTINQQGADKGTQYRSVILFHDPAQEQTARDIINELKPLFEKPIVTELIPFTDFYKAEESHQNYYRENPEKLYCQAVIDPKLSKVRKQFADKLNQEV